MVDVRWWNLLQGGGGKGRVNGPCFLRRGVVVKDLVLRARRRRHGRQQVSGDGWRAAIP